MRPSSAPLAVGSALVLSAALGTIHAFSAFIEPLEQAYLADRSAISLIYSLALLSLTGAVLLSHRIFQLATPGAVIAGVAITAALGLAIAAWGQGLTAALLGYGLIFGFANGVGYALALQLAAHADPGRRGLLMGAVTAVYAVGAMVWAKGLDVLLGHWAAEGAFLTWAGLVLLLVGLAAMGAGRSGITVSAKRTSEVAGAGGPVPLDRRRLGLLWLGYFTGCLAGLMAIGHAAAMVSAAGADLVFATWGIVVISLGNATAGLLAGFLADRISLRGLMAGLPGLSALALIYLAFAAGPTATLAALFVVGFAYGGIIALYPVAASRFFGLAEGARAYGIVFTSWGLAGLFGPVMAGHLYDLTDSYRAPALVAAAVAVVSCGAVWRLPKS